MSENLIHLAAKNLTDILNLSIKHQAPEKALVIYDTQNGLTDIITAAYRMALPAARFLDIDSVGKEEVLAAMNSMQPNDLVVLVQSMSFRLDDFRIRLHLFNLKLKVIEHVHLARNSEDVWDVYVNSLAYDSEYYHRQGLALQAALAPSTDLRLQSGTGKNFIELRVDGALEGPKLNIGDYTGMETVGGTFPIGEVFTEAEKFETVSGSFMVYAFAGMDFVVKMYEPFRVDITQGLVTGWSDNAPAHFVEIIDAIKSIERPLLREIGFGLNRAITKERYLQDITAYERVYGMHFSLGEKHSVYKKAGMPTKKTKFHIDLFPVIDQVLVNGQPIFTNGKYQV